MKYYIIDHSDSEMKGYQSSLDGSDNNFDFNDDHDDNAQSFSRMFILLFCFFILIFRFLENQNMHLDMMNFSKKI